MEIQLEQVKYLRQSIRLKSCKKDYAAKFISGSISNVTRLQKKILNQV